MVPKTYSIPLWWNEVEKKMLTPRKLIIKIFYLRDNFLNNNYVEDEMVIEFSFLFGSLYMVNYHFSSFILFQSTFLNVSI